MPTFENLESLASVRAKINDGIANAETAITRLNSQDVLILDHENRIDALEALGGGGGVTDGDKGDVIVSGSGATWTLDPTTASSLRDRSTHTGTQSVGTITGLATIATSGSAANLTGTKAQFDTAVTDGNFMYVGDAPTAHTHTLAAGATDVTITAANLNTLDDGVNTTLHFHDTDRDRANHTGTQLASTISDFSTAVAATAAVTANTAKVTNATHTGDATGATALTLATVNSNVGAFGSATQVPTFTVNAKGLTTAAANVSISIPSTAISDSTSAGRNFLTAASVTAQTALLDAFTSGAKGLAPASGGGTTNFLRADGTWAAPAGGGGSPGGSSGEVQYNNAGAFAGAADVEIEGGQLRLPEISTPTTPASGGIKAYGKRAGRALLAFLGADGQEFLSQPVVSRQHFAQWYPQGNGTTVVNLGLTPNFIGTATTQNVATTSFYTMCKRIGYLVTTAATNAVAEWRMGARLWTIGGTRAGEGGFTMTLRFGCSTGVATATTRLFAGFRTDGNSGNDVDPSTIASSVLFGWDNGDTNCQIIHRRAGAATKIDLGSSFARPSVNDTDVFEVTLYSPPGTTQEVYYEVKRLNTGAVASGVITTNLPSTSTLGSPQITYSVGGTSSVIGISVMKVTMESNY